MPVGYVLHHVVERHMRGNRWGFLKVREHLSFYLGAPLLLESWIGLDWVLRHVSELVIVMADKMMMVVVVMILLA